MRRWLSTVSRLMPNSLASTDFRSLAAARSHSDEGTNVRLPLTSRGPYVSDASADITLDQPDYVYGTNRVFLTTSVRPELSPSVIVVRVLTGMCAAQKADIRPTTQ